MYKRGRKVRDARHPPFLLFGTGESGPAHLDRFADPSLRSELGIRLQAQRTLVLPFAKLAEHRVPDYYALLAVSPSASSADIKAAYHRALLASHPDKRNSITAPNSADIGQLKQAFHTLNTPSLRKEYDTLRASSDTPRGPRPAQVISLEEFNEEDGEAVVWAYPCRCGGRYMVTEEMLDAGQHLVGCTSCSEVVWAGYELVDIAEDSKIG